MRTDMPDRTEKCWHIRIRLNAELLAGRELITCIRRHIDPHKRLFVDQQTDQLRPLCHAVTLLPRQAVHHGIVCGEQTQVSEGFFVDGQPRINRWRTMVEVPATTPEAEALSKELKHRGFRFIGPTVMYAHMQATGMVNDHLISCHRHAELAN